MQFSKEKPIKKQLRKIRLGKGEFEHIKDVEMPYSVRDARDYLLDAVKDVKPEVLQDLAGEPIKNYKIAGLAFDREHYVKEVAHLEHFEAIRAMTRLQTQHRFNHPDWFGHFENEVITYSEKIRTMQKSIFDWSVKHNLDVGWCRARAYETLDKWCQFDSFRENLLWSYQTEMQPMIATNRGDAFFTFKMRSNYPMFGFRADEERNITESFKRELKVFLDNREELAKENGMVKPQQKREYLHFIWLARWQMDENLTHKKITEELSKEESNPKFLDVQAISKAIKEVATLIGLPLRKSKRGKKPTSVKSR